MIFRADLSVAGGAQQEFAQHYPAPGWVEHDPEDLWASTLATMRGAIAKAHLQPCDIAAIGITNQRETGVLWDRRDRQARSINALVWQDRRTADICAKLRGDGCEPLISARTGLVADPYFSATKIAWILDHVDGARAQAEAGKLACGTIDCFLLWRLTGGRVHATDATNAARTLLFDIHRGAWDDDLCTMLRVPRALLPDVRDCAADFGTTLPDILGAPVAIAGMAGDQQAATVGQACFCARHDEGDLWHRRIRAADIGNTAVASRNRLLTTIAYQLKGQRTYALEGSIFVAGAAVQWLRDGLGILARADEAGTLAAQSDPSQPVYLVPAFVGLGAPHWDAECRGTLSGLTRGTGRNEIVRAALECVGYQTRDLVQAMYADSPAAAQTVLRVDGGMAASDFTMQFLADILDAPVDRPQVTETTALGAAWLAGLHAGVLPGQDEFARTWLRERRFTPAMSETTRSAKIAGWTEAVSRTLSAR